MRKFWYLIGCAMLSGCGGSSNPGSGPVTLPTIPTLTVTLAPSMQTQTASEANSVTSFTVQASFTGSTSDSITPQFTFDNTILALDGDIVRSGNVFTAQFKTRSGLSAASRTTPISFKLCRDGGTCGTVYPGSSQSFDYTLDVKLSNWVTRQRNAAHNGYVHATFDPTKFTSAWEFAPTSATSFQPVAALEGTVFVVQRHTDGTSIAIALNGTTGTERWRYSLGPVHNASAPAIALSENHVVAIQTMTVSSGSNPIVMLNAVTGTFFRNSFTAAQWSNFAPPTPLQDHIYSASGYFGNVVYSHDVKTGVEEWTRNGSGGNTWDGQAPAVDDDYVYYYSGKLDVISRVTGGLLKSVDDPFWQWNGYSYGGTPMIGSANHVIAYSGNGQGTYPVAFPLVDYDISGGVYRWRTASSYHIIPAVANGVVYAASNQTSQLDAIDEKNGQILWSWPLPASETFVGNIVVTDTLLFVSTNAKTYAIDLTSHQSKWSASSSGWLAITPDAKLVVVPANGTLPAKVTAYSLR